MYKTDTIGLGQFEYKPLYFFFKGNFTYNYNHGEGDAQLPTQVSGSILFFYRDKSTIDGFLNMFVQKNEDLSGCLGQIHWFLFFSLDIEDSFFLPQIFNP